MSAIAELLELKGRLESQIESLRGELDTISKTVKILEREHPHETPQLSFKVMTAPAQTEAQSTPNKQARFGVEVGLSERCLFLLGSEWLQPSTVRDRLIATEYHNKDRGKLLSSVYATLKRLHSMGRVEMEKRGDVTFYHRTEKVNAA